MNQNSLFYKVLIKAVELFEYPKLKRTNKKMAQMTEEINEKNKKLSDELEKVQKADNDKQILIDQQNATIEKLKKQLLSQGSGL